MNTDTLLKNNPLLHILDKLPLATAIYTSEDIIIQHANNLMFKIWGKDERILGKPMEEGIPELRDQPFIDILKGVWRTGITYSAVSMPAELVINGKRQRNYFDFEYQALRNNEGEIFAILNTAYDVTENHENVERIRESEIALSREQVLNEELATTNEELIATVEELHDTQDKLSTLNDELEEKVNHRTRALAESEERIRFMLNDAPVAIALLTGRNMVIASANKKILEAWGKTEAIIGTELKLALPELEGQEFLDLLDNVYTSGEAFYGNEVKALLEHNGVIEENYFNFVYQPLKDQDGNSFGIVVTANTVTEQVLSRKKIERSEHRLKDLVNNAPMGMTILRGRDLVVELANQPMLDIWNHGREEILGRKLLDIFPELTDQPYPQMLLNVFDSGQGIKMPEMEADIISPHGNKHIYIYFTYDPLFNDKGQVEGILATVIDITEIVETRKLLEKNEAELQSINEELTATVEELAASNEELITTQDSLQDMYETIASSESRFRFMLNAIPQQVWTAGPDGALDYVNEVVCRDFGYTTEEIVGHGWKSFIHPDDLESCLNKWIVCLGTGTDYEVEFRLRFYDDTYHWHLARAVPLIENGSIALWLGTNTNIQTQKDIETKKDEFLSIASHELKTPLTSIKAFNQLMQRINEPAKLGSFIQKSSEHIARLEKLISDLLDVTKINAGKLVYTMEPFLFDEMVKNSVETLQHTSSSHQLILETNESCEYTGDRFRIEMVLNNFIYNAIKYSPDGKRIIINSRCDGENLIVSVQDFGIGIEEKNLDKLFDRYYRVDNTAVRFDGLGLGLFISAEILKRHSGSFWIESKKDQGSTFYFRLPLKPESESKVIKITDSFYKDSTVIINYNPFTTTLELDWTGYQNLETVQSGSLKALDMVKRFHCRKILNDNRKVLGTWSDASDWVGQILYPMMEEAGVTHVGWILSSGSFGQLSARKSLDVAIGKVVTELFSEPEKAKEWLDSF